MAEAGTIGITGASGFVGRTLIDELVRQKRTNLRLFGRGGILAVGPYRIERSDFSPETWAGIDCLVHLAGITNTNAPEAELTLSNVDLTVNIARAAAAAGVRRFVFVSSLGVHGKSAHQAISPVSPFLPDNAYGRSKATAERALRSVCEDGKLELVILRPPMIYGPGTKGNFPLLLRLVRSGLPLPFASATARRSFCSIANLVSALLAALDRSSIPGVLIPADPEDFSTRTLVQVMKSAAETSTLLFPVPERVLRQSLALVGKADMAISLFEPLYVDRVHWMAWDWEPVESGEQGVRSAVDHVRAADVGSQLVSQCLIEQIE